MNTTENLIIEYNSNQVEYASHTHVYSDLTNHCTTVTQAIEDIYNQLEETYIDFQESDFESEENYITYPSNLNFYEVVKQHHTEIKNLIDEINLIKNKNICNLLISNCNLELGALTDECGQQPETFEDLINIILNELNNG